MQAGQYDLNTPRIAWCCPHGGGKFRFHCDEWPEPIHSFTNWTRYTNSILFYGEDEMATEKSRLDDCDGFFFMQSVGRIPKMVDQLREWYGDSKKIAILTDGYAFDFAEEKRPCPDYVNCVNEKVDLILGNRPDIPTNWRHLTDTEIFWLGFPVEDAYVNQFRVPLHQRNKNLVSLGGGVGCVTGALAIHRAFPDVKFLAFKTPSHEYDRRRIRGSGWFEGLNIPIRSMPDSPWKKFLEKTGKCYIGIHFDLAGQMGRFSTDHAILRVPLISTNRCGRHEQLQPNLTVYPLDDGLGEMIELFAKLRDDPSFYKDCARLAARNALDIYGIEPSLARWGELMRKLFG